MQSYNDSYKLILAEVENACSKVEQEQVEQLVSAILSSRKVFLVGVGRVMLSLMAFCKRLNHLGISAHCVGDINEPAITSDDLLIVGSGSGETAFVVAIAKIAKKYGARVAHIGSNPQSTIALITDVFVRIPVSTKLNLQGEIQSQQIMSSLFEQSLYVVCDSVCYMICKRNNIEIKSLWEFHANLE